MNRLFENRFAAVVFAGAMVIVSIVPLTGRETHAHQSVVEEPQWPSEVDGKALVELPLTPTEKRFAADFPGRIKRFTDGERVFILRWVTRATRKLHPASDCFRGLGYVISPRGVTRDSDGREWGCFVASRNGSTLQVGERIMDSSGRGWTEVQAWFWAAAFGQTFAPWWAWTEVK